MGHEVIASIATQDGVARCRRCGRQAHPAPAWGDDTALTNEPRYVGFFPCRCSRTAFLAQRWDAESWEDYQERIAAEDRVPVMPLSEAEYLRHHT